MLAITGTQVVDIIAVAAFVAAGLYAWRLRRGDFPRKLKQLEERGYVVEKRVQRQNDRKVTLIWGRLPQAVNLRFQIVESKLLDQSRRFAESDAVQLGDSEFDERFAVLMDLPQFAPAILDEPMRQRLLGLEEANFTTGSIASLLEDDSFPEVQGGERGVLQLWAMHLDREKASNAELRSVVELGRTLAKKVAEVAKADGLTPQ
jgi:hypothetical protein